MGTFSSACSELVGEVMNSGVEMGNLVSKMSVGFFKLGASGFAVMKSSLEIGTFSPACIKLVGEVSNNTVEMANLFSKMMIGLLKLMASGLASS
jgi:hypothetical protein